MRIPTNMTEAEVLAIFNKVISKLSYKFKFSGHSIEDMKQEALLYAIEGIERYDESRPLENFIFTHVHNRLYNFKRNNYFRLEKPCEHCPVGAFIRPDGCSAFENREDCQLFAGWQKRNVTRKNLTNLLEYNQVSSNERSMGYDTSLSDNLNIQEILDLIDVELPVNLRKNYLQLLEGNRIPKKDRLELEEVVSNILKKHNYEL